MSKALDSATQISNSLDIHNRTLFSNRQTRINKGNVQTQYGHKRYVRRQRNNELDKYQHFQLILITLR